MFWKILSAVVRTSTAINRTVTALGAATIITLGVYEFVKNRRKR